MLPKNFRVKTPHAAIKIWNYVDRITAEGVVAHEFANVVKEEIVSTLSCSAIQTVKAKASPVGQFHFVLAPTRNWTAVITPGSWCVIMMSNEPITQQDFKKANPKLVKMVGKIETVRTNVTTNDEGARTTQFLVSGQDWGQVFQNTLYIDPLVLDPNENSNNQGTALFTAIMRVILKDGSPALTKIRDNLQALLNLTGKNLDGIEGQIPRLAKNTHKVAIPTAMCDFFGFNQPEIMSLIQLTTGALRSDSIYSDVDDGFGYINAHNLVGGHSLWQVLQDNANPTLNEMFSDIVWKDGKARLELFNRVKPFAFRSRPISSEIADLRSQFQYVPHTELDDITIISLNAGTNWRDKINFIEIKPESSEFAIFDGHIKLKSQLWDTTSNDVFDREGFRPLILAAKQLPGKKVGDVVSPDPERLTTWTGLLQEWFFDTHRLLNGQLIMTGSSDYITVGSNIMFDAGLLGVKPNHNASTNLQEKCFILAHVESVTNSFKVDANGARNFETTIDFVRGIVVDKQKNLIGDGVLDAYSTALTKEASTNDTTVVASPSSEDPEFKE